MATVTNIPVFWLTNISNRNVSLSDLNLTVKALTSINLLDSKHYTYTIDQLKKSAASGSIFKKRNKLVVRKNAPEIITMNIPFAHETYIGSRERSVLSLKENRYEELDLSDTQFAEENSETAEMDRQPLNKRV